VAAIFSEALNIRAETWYSNLYEDAVDDAFGNALLLLDIKSIIVPIAATAQWLVLRKALPELSWGLWLLAAGAAALSMVLTFLLWGSFASGLPTAFAFATWLVLSAAANAIVLAFALGWGAGQWPRAFVYCSVLAAVVTAPLYLAVEFSSLIPRGPSSLNVVGHETGMITLNLSLKLAAVALGASISGYGLRLFFRGDAEA
jgi:hypothetical protein